MIPVWNDDYAILQSDLANAVAYLSHRGQERSCQPPEPYYEHVRRVAMRFPPGPCRAAGLLHDVLEDTQTTADELDRLGVDGDVVRAVELLTHEHGINGDEYLRYIERIRDGAETGDPAAMIARAVKLSDLADNVSALPRMEPRTRSLLSVRYAAALDALTERRLSRAC